MAGPSFSQTTSEVVVPSPHSIATSPYITSESEASNIVIPQINTHASVNVQLTQQQFKYSTAEIKDEHESPGAYASSVQPLSVQPLPVQMTRILPNIPHSCEPQKGCEMSIEILYRSCKMAEFHIEDEKGCRITHGALSPESESKIPDAIQDALFGVDAKVMTVIELPQWPHGICNEELIPSVNDLLKNMQRGVLLACSNGDINAIRLCKTSIYYSSILDEDSKKLVRHDSVVEKTKIFDFENDFKPALEKYKIKKGPRPCPDIYLFIGQKGSKRELNNQLIVVKVSSCLALQLLKEADDQTLNSFHISDPTDYDTITDCVLGQLSNDDNDSEIKYTEESNMSMQE